MVYWGGTYARHPIEFDETNLVASDKIETPTNVQAPHIYITGTLDGTKVHALVDTGSSVSVMTLQQADVILGWHGLPAEAKKVGSFRGNEQYLYPFKTLSFGGITINNPKMLITNVTGPGTESDEYDLVLGMDVLRHLHLYISYAEKTLYVTPAATAQPASSTEQTVR